MPESPVYDIVGVGFGPSNLALAIAVREYNESVPPRSRLNAMYLEHQETFGWHRGMLLENTTMQMAFLKDLVTPRNPRSRFSFIAYLHERGRLIDFINHRILYPTRLEFHDYLRWAANAFREQVLYGSEVTGVHLCPSGKRFVVSVGDDNDDGADRSLYARNVVLAQGTEPILPETVRITERIFHSSELLDRLDRLGQPPPQGAVVVGAGQSGAEVAAYLHERYPKIHVHAVIRRYGFCAFDDSPYVNRLYDPDAVGAFYAMDDELRAQIRRDYRNTSYSVVETELIDELFRRVYNETVNGERRLFLHNLSEVAAVHEEEGSRVSAHMRSLATGESHSVAADFVVYATGYRAVDPYRIVRPELAEASAEQSGVGRDYALQSGGRAGRGRIYVLGAATEATHGISAAALSLISVRSGEVVRAIARGTDEHRDRTNHQRKQVLGGV